MDTAAWVVAVAGWVQVFLYDGVVMAVVMVLEVDVLVYKIFLSHYICLLEKDMPYQSPDILFPWKGMLCTVRRMFRRLLGDHNVHI
jgi:hypothetical protein